MGDGKFGSNECCKGSRELGWNRHLLEHVLALSCESNSLSRRYPMATGVADWRKWTGTEPKNRSKSSLRKSTFNDGCSFQGTELMEGKKDSRERPT